MRFLLVVALALFHVTHASALQLPTSASIRTVAQPAAQQKAYRSVPAEHQPLPGHHVVEITFTRLPGDGVVVVDAGSGAEWHRDDVDDAMAGMSSLLAMMAQPRQWLSALGAEAADQHALDMMLPLVAAARQPGVDDLAVEADVYAIAAPAASVPSPAPQPAPGLLQRLRDLGRKVEVMWGLHLTSPDDQQAGEVSLGRPADPDEAAADSEAGIDWLDALQRGGMHTHALPGPVHEQREQPPLTLAGQILPDLRQDLLWGTGAVTAWTTADVLAAAGIAIGPCGCGDEQQEGEGDFDGGSEGGDAGEEEGGSQQAAGGVLAEVRRRLQGAATRALGPKRRGGGKLRRQHVLASKGRRLMLAAKQSAAPGAGVGAVAGKASAPARKQAFEANARRHGWERAAAPRRHHGKAQQPQQQKGSKAEGQKVEGAKEEGRGRGHKAAHMARRGADM